MGFQGYKIRMDRDSILNLLGDDLGRTLNQMIRQADRDSYKWHSTKENRAALVNKIEKSPATISRYIKKLEEKGIITHWATDARGTYSINRRLIEFK